MKYYSIPLIKGVVKDAHPRLIPDTKASDVSNIMFKEESFQPRWGYATFGGNLPLNGAITAMGLLRRNNGDQILVAFTYRDAYFFQQNTGLWLYITRSYITGTIEVASGTGVSATVDGTSTVWDNTLWGATDIYEIKFGDTDVNSAGTWYTVASVDSATQITLATAISAVASGTAYVLRLRYTGSADDLHSIAYPYDASNSALSYVGTDDKIMMVTNGVDPVLKWDGTGTMELVENIVVGETMPVAKYISFFGSKGFAHTILSWLVETGENFPQTIEVSDAGYPNAWEANQYSFFDTQDEIVGIKSLQSRMILYKKETMTEMWVDPSGDNTDPFGYNENKVRDIGTPSIRTVHEFGTFHIFMGWDNVYVFDGVSVIPIGTDLINTMIRESNRAFLSVAFALPILSENLYCLFIPTGELEYADKCFVYNYREKFWTIWDLTHTIDTVVKAKMTSHGYTFKEDSPTWNEVLVNDNDWNNWDLRWKDLLVYEDNMTYLLGDSDGYIYELSPDFTDDKLLVSSVVTEQDVECSITTKDFPLNDPKHVVKLCQLVIGMIRFADGDLRVRTSIDFGTNWGAWLTIPNTPETGDALYVEHIANFVQRGRQVRFQIENVDGADFEIESLVIGFNDDKGVVSASNI